MIQSQPFFLNFVSAFLCKSEVSAAKPITNWGLFSFKLLTWRKISGFSLNFNTGERSLSFLIFCSATSSKYQSPTAATKTATSAGNSSNTALYISRPVSIFTKSTLGGVATVLGPVIKTTLAPKSAKALAIAVPCAPDDLFAIYLIGSIISCVVPDVTIMRLPESGPCVK